MPEFDPPTGGGGGGTGTAAPGAAPAPGSTSPGGLSGGSAVAITGPTPQTPQQLPKWIGAFAGINAKIPSHAIGEYECDEIMNLLIDGRTLKQRGGYETVLDTLTATSWSPYGGVKVYGLNPGTPYDFIAGSFDGTTRIYSSRSGAWASAYSGFTAGPTDYPRVEFLPTRTPTEEAVYVFFGNTTQIPQKVTGADTFANVSWTPTIRPSVGVVHKGRLWVNDMGNPARLWMSDTGVPDTMRDQTSATVATEGGYITIDIPGGDQINMIASFGNFLVVFSERSIHFVSGSSFSNFSVAPAFEKIGTKSPRSVRLCENDLWFLDSMGIVRFISGSQPNVNATVSTAVPGYYIEPITKAIPSNRLGRVNAVYSDRRYWLFHVKAGGAANERALCWEFRELPVPGSRWTVHKCLHSGYAWTEQGAGTDEKILFLDSFDPVLKRFPVGTTDGTTAIRYTWKSRAYDAGVPGWEKGLGRVAPVTLAFTGSMTFNVYSNLSTTVAQTRTLTYVGGDFERQSTLRLASSTQGRLLQIELDGTSEAGFELAGIEFEMTRKRRAGIG